MPVYAEPQHLEVSLDGERLQFFTLPGVGRRVRGRLSKATMTTPLCQRLRRPAPNVQAPQQANAPAPRAQISQVDRRGPRLSGREREQRNKADETWNVRVR